ncbi:hypothetical protein [Mucilaginibacter sp. KACC 22063]|uniref:hypothetical protein n=1 Tax=Mucilaginibacter sp. KACC 22063 TaxID=3025666 RepID=UPI002365C824|nr:hypothetical protein [Mucilaginibacter sp. KACC 22063]WDF54209.1 hypothetical protein PQ461_14780 [Mucilaginibacter sp. KACC 22063]
MNWKFYKSVIDGHDLFINGLNIWSYEWLDQKQYVWVKDPIYGEDHVMGIYEITDGVTIVRFAAGEFSNLVWGIYLPDE